MIEADIQKIRNLEVEWAAHDPMDEVIPLILRALDEREALFKALRMAMLREEGWRETARRALKWATGP